jgi:hypothetical protein
MKRFKIAFCASLLLSHIVLADDCWFTPKGKKKFSKLELGSCPNQPEEDCIIGSLKNGSRVIEVINYRNCGENNCYLISKNFNYVMLSNSHGRVYRVYIGDNKGQHNVYKICRMQRLRDPFDYEWY